MNSFVEVKKDQFVNMSHVVKGVISISNFQQVEEDKEWRHYTSIAAFYSKSKQVIILKLVDGSTVISAGIEECQSSYYAGVWEALNPKYEFEFPEDSIIIGEAHV